MFPSAADILSGLHAITGRWTEIAALWHIAVGALLAALLGGWSPLRARLGLLLALPLLSVSVLAWDAGNAFNALLFLIAASALTGGAAALPRMRLHRARNAFAVLGLGMIAFGWTYPHFLEETDNALRYFYAAPTGLIPCPTLAVIIGFALLTNGLESRALSLGIVLLGLFYALFGILRLGVAIDAGLAIGALALLIQSFTRR